ncbi:MAG TPA: hypothetical protein PLQ19_09665 [Aeromicrobium sp.]|nr:hypothetical protein [Aeromicrobium sp.]
MAFFWQYENESGESIGQSENFEDRVEAEGWIGTAFDELLESGIERVNLFDDADLVYGPMSLRAE